MSQDCPQPPDLDPVVPAGASFDGTLAFRGEARVDGALKGRILARGRLWLGPQARVTGEVEAEEVVVAGAVEGPVRARHRIRLLAGSRVRGEVAAARIQLDDGSILDGRCVMRAEPAEPD